MLFAEFCSSQSPDMSPKCRRFAAAEPEMMKHGITFHILSIMYNFIEFSDQSTALYLCSSHAIIFCDKLNILQNGVTVLDSHYIHRMTHYNCAILVNGH